MSDIQQTNFKNKDSKFTDKYFHCGPVVIVEETEKAALCEFSGLYSPRWVPKSVMIFDTNCVNEKAKANQTKYSLCVKLWFSAKNNCFVEKDKNGLW